MTSRYNAREKPADFDAMRKMLVSQVALQRHYAAGCKAVRRWMKDQDGETPMMVNPPPVDFELMAKRVYKQALARHYGRSTSTIERWERLSGVKCTKVDYIPPHNLRPIPVDFVQRAAVMIKSELLRHYGAGYDVVERWIAQSGAVTKKYRPPVYIRPTNTRSHAPMPGRSLGNDRRHEGAYGPEEQAADVLRKRGPVYRCDDRGRMAEKGKFWRVGMVVCTGPDLIARAERRSA